MKYSPKRVLARAFGGKSPASPASLRTWYLALAGLLAAQGIVLLLLGSAYVLPVYMLHLTSDMLQTHLSGAPVAALSVYELARVNMTYLVAVTLFVPALVSVAAGTIWRTSLAGWTKNNWQPVRWALVALIGSGLVVGLALLAGLRTWDALASMVALTALASLAACGVELLYQGKGKLRTEAKMLLTIALVAGLLPWIEVLKTMVATRLFGNITVPGYLWWLYGTSLLGWLLIVGNGIMSARRVGKWANAVYVEYWYVALLFFVASAFCWQLFAAILHP